MSIFVCQFSTRIIFYLIDNEFKGQNLEDKNGKIIRVKLAIGFVDDTRFFVRRKYGIIDIVIDIYDKYISLYEATNTAILLENSTYYHWKWLLLNGKLLIVALNNRTSKLLLEQINLNVTIYTLGMKLDTALQFSDAKVFIEEKLENF